MRYRVMTVVSEEDVLVEDVFKRNSRFMIS